MLHFRCHSCWVSCAVCVRALQSESCSEEGDNGFGGEEHLSTEQNRIKVLRTKDQTSKECEYKSCGLPICPVFLPIPGERGGFKTQSGKTSRALPNFVSSRTVIRCILRNQGRKGCFVACLGFGKGFAAGLPRCLILTAGIECSCQCWLNGSILW